MKRTKILHVVGAMNRAGTETMLMNIYRNIDHEKVQFDFISFDKQKAHYDEEIVNLGGKVIKVKKTPSIIKLYQAMKENGPYDVVHSHTLFHAGIANLIAFFAGVKIRIAHAHTTADKSNSYVRKAYMIIMRYLIRTFSTDLLACSEAAGIYLFGNEAINKASYKYFPNVIEYKDFLTVQQSDISKFKIEEGLGNHIVIGHIGTFKESKNHQFLIKVMKSLKEMNPNTKLLLVGDGSLKGSIQKAVYDTNLVEYVSFAGIKENIPTVMHSMDVFVFPSIYEGLGLVLLEAQASGLPCVVSEAIQPEADLGLNLITRCSLAKGPEFWAEQIMKQLNRRERDKNKIINQFETSDYSVTNGIQTLMKVYQVFKGGTYESNVNRLL